MRSLGEKYVDMELVRNPLVTLGGDLIWRLGEAMRYAVRCLSCILLLLVTATTLTAQETKAPWWHFGRGENAAASPSNVTPAPTLTPAPETITPVDDDPWFAWPSMPKWHWPGSGEESDSMVSDLPAGRDSDASESRSRFTRFRFGKPEHESRPRNTWAQQPASTATPTESESTWQAMKTHTHNAWSKTVDFVTPGEGTETAVVAAEPRESWWKRMWGSDEPDDGPQTITEWMAQDRLDP